MLMSSSAEVMQQDIPICAWVPAGTEPFSRGGLALFYLGFFREEVGGGGRGICRRLCMTAGCTIQRGGLARPPRQDHARKRRSGRDAEQRQVWGWSQAWT